MPAPGTNIRGAGASPIDAVDFCKSPQHERAENKYESRALLSYRICGRGR